MLELLDALESVWAWSALGWPCLCCQQIIGQDMWDDPVTYYPRKEGSAVSGNWQRHMWGGCLEVGPEGTAVSWPGHCPFPNGDAQAHASWLQSQTLGPACSTWPAETGGFGTRCVCVKQVFLSVIVLGDTESLNVLSQECFLYYLNALPGTIIFFQW